MPTTEIVLPITEPESEWILGRALQKMSPTRKHGVLQRAFGEALHAWAKAGARGQVATEWRFRASPPGEEIRPLVPDVAFLSYERLRPLSEADRDVPPVAPEIVVEIRSSDDRQRDIDEKRRVYFSWGVALLIIADPQTESIEVFGRDGFSERVAGAEEAYTPSGFPELVFPLRAMFAELTIP
jgi:Uma2 family endonuclease